MATMGKMSLDFAAAMRRAMSPGFRRRGRKYRVAELVKPKQDVHYSSADTREERAYFR